MKFYTILELLSEVILHKEADQTYILEFFQIIRSLEDSLLSNYS